MRIATFAGVDYYAFSKSENQRTKEPNKMDDYDGKTFYKAKIEKLIEETNDLGLLDLVYRILLQQGATTATRL